MPSNWIWHTPGRTTPRLRLLCLPNAGAGASTFRGWSASLPEDIEVLSVQLPGREERLSERPFDNLPELIAALGPAIEPWLEDSPFAIYGHSMGALIAFELARWLRAAYRPMPRHLFLAGHRGPHLPDPGPFFHTAPDADLLDELRRLCGTHPHVLGNRELMALYLPTVRADLAVCETYQYVPGPRLACPITAYGGTRDTEASAYELLGWREHTTRNFRLRMFEGDHFFPISARAEMLAALATDVSPHVFDHHPAEVAVA
jgi:medium-chain acyl-[acyl-carrier-protein] hydrolase